jgi:hypothetical protein
MARIFCGPRAVDEGGSKVARQDPVDASSLSTSMLQLDLRPGEGLGPFKLGMF